MEALNAASLRQTTLMVTHQLEDLAEWDVMGMQIHLSVRGIKCGWWPIRHITGPSSGGDLNARFATLSGTV